MKIMTMMKIEIEQPALTRRERGWRRDFPAAARRPCQMGSPCQPGRHHHYYDDDDQL